MFIIYFSQAGATAGACRPLTVASLAKRVRAAPAGW